MSSDKQIKISLSVDTQSVQRAKQAIGELIKDFGKLSAVMSQLGQGGGGGIGHGIPGITTGGMVGAGNSQQTVMQRAASPTNKNSFAQTILENKQLLSSTANIGRDALRVMSESLNRSVGTQKRDLLDLERTIKQLTRSYDDLKNAQGAAAASGVNPAGYEGKLDEAAAGLAGAVGQKRKSEQKLQDLQDQQKALLNQGGPGGGGGPPPNRSMSPEDKGRTFGAGLQLAGSAIGTFATMAQNAKTMGAINGAKSADFGRFLINSALSGDAYPFFAMGMKRGEGLGGKGLGNFKDFVRDAGDLDDLKAIRAGRGLATVGSGVISAFTMNSGINGVPGVAGGPNVGGLLGTGKAGRMSDVSNVGGGAGGVSGAVGDLGNNLMGGLYGANEAEASQTQLTALQAVMARNPLYEAMFSTMRQMAGARVGASKATQGHHWAAAGTGRGFGLDFGDSNSAAHQLIRGFGVGGVFDSNVRDEIEVSSTGSRFTPAHRRAGLLRSTLQLEAMGMDRGAAGNMMGMMSGAIGGNREAASEQAFSRLGDAMGKAISRNLKDSRLFEEIGTAMAEASFDKAGGKISTGAFGRMLSAGLDENSSLQDVQAGTRGTGALSDFMKTNPWLNANMVRAAQAMGVHSGQALGIIQRTGVAGLMAEENPMLDALLGDKGKDRRQGIFKSTMNVLGANFIRPAETPELFEAFKTSGGDFSKALAKGGSKARYQAVAGVEMMLGTDEMAAEKIIDQLSSLGGGFGGNKSVGGGAYKNHTDANAAMTVALSSDSIAKLAMNETRIKDAFKAAVHEAMQVQEKSKGADLGIAYGQTLTVMVLGPAPAAGPGFTGPTTAARRK